VILDGRIWGRPLPPDRHLRCVSFLAIVSAALLVSACSAQRAEMPLLTPAPDSPITGVSKPGSIAIGEVNGDGKTDLVVAGARGVTVLLGRGDGRFRVAPGSPIGVPTTTATV
jgi:FG-GAP-like repeat